MKVFLEKLLNTELNIYQLPESLYEYEIDKVFVDNNRIPKTEFYFIYDKKAVCFKHFLIENPIRVEAVIKKVKA